MSLDLDSSSDDEIKKERSSQVLSNMLVIDRMFLTSSFYAKFEEAEIEEEMRKQRM